MNNSLNSISTVLSLSSIAVASLLLTACSEPPAPAAIVKPVFVTTVTPANSAQSRSFTSVIRPRVETELGFRTGGKVVERLVEVGDSVKAGQVLARLDPVDYRLAVKAAADQVQAASVEAQQAASDEARFRRLLADGSVGAADHERQKARADAAAARLDQASRQLELAARLIQACCSSVCTRLLPLVVGGAHRSVRQQPAEARLVGSGLLRLHGRGLHLVGCRLHGQPVVDRIQTGQDLAGLDAVADFHEPLNHLASGPKSELRLHAGTDH